MRNCKFYEISVEYNRTHSEYADSRLVGLEDLRFSHRYFDAQERINIRRVASFVYPVAPSTCARARGDFNNFSLAYTPVSRVYGILRYFMPGFINIFMRFRLGGTFYCNCAARATDIPEITIYIPSTGKYSTVTNQINALYDNLPLRHAPLVSFLWFIGI